MRLGESSMKNSKYLMMIMLSLSVLQMACSDKKKVKDFWAECSKSQACLDQYRNAAKAVAIGGPAAAAGLPQLANATQGLLPGQVPDPKLLPASISEQQIKAQAVKIEAALNELGGYSPKPAAPSGGAVTPTSAGRTFASGGGGPEQVEIGVTRLPDYGPASPETGSFSAASASTPFDNFSVSDPQSGTSR